MTDLSVRREERLFLLFQHSNLTGAVERTSRGGGAGFTHRGGGGGGSVMALLEIGVVDLFVWGLVLD